MTLEGIAELKRFSDVQGVLTRAIQARAHQSDVGLVQASRPTKAAIQKFYCSHSEQIRAAIGQWKEGEPLPRLEGEADAFLVCRIATALCFVQQSYTIGSIVEGTSPLVLRSDTGTFVRWLLTEWFETHGALEAYMADHSDVVFPKRE